MKICPLCHNYGSRQIYIEGRVRKIFCSCPTGKKRLKIVEKALEKVGINSIYYDEIKNNWTLKLKKVKQ